MVAIDLREKPGAITLRHLEGLIAESDGKDSAGVLFRNENGDPICFYCKVPLDNGNRHNDHIIPSSRNGSDKGRNIVGSCDSCNIRKQAKTPLAWLFSEHMLGLIGEGKFNSDDIAVFLGLSCAELISITEQASLVLQEEKKRARVDARSFFQLWKGYQHLELAVEDFLNNKDAPIEHLTLYIERLQLVYQHVVENFIARQWRSF